MFKPLGADLRSTVALAWPVIVAELGWMAMGIVDTIMVGSLGPAAIGAVGLGSGIYLAAAIFGMGLLLGLDALVSQAFGARNVRECHRWLLHGVYLALLTAGPFTLACFIVAWTMPHWGLHPSVAGPSRDYLSTVAWGTLPLLLYAAFRRYLQATHLVLPVMVVLVSANLVNAGFNWLLILGHFGFPALGTTGSAWATVISRWYMALGLGAVILWHERRQAIAGVRRTTRSRLAAAQSAAPAGRACGHADHRRGRRLRSGDVAGGTARSGVVGSASGLYSTSPVSRSWCRWAFPLQAPFVSAMLSDETISWMRGGRDGPRSPSAWPSWRVRR